MASRKDVDTVDAETVPVKPSRPLSYDELIAQYEGRMDVVEGSDLQQKLDLLDVPLVITSATFRGVTVTRDYVSLEAVAKDKGNVIFNDGSTGVKRQILRYLHETGRLKAADTEWDAEDNPDAQIAADGDNVRFEGLLLHCPRGLRMSEYTVEDGPAAGESATTFYLA